MFALKQKAISLLEHKLGKTGLVLDVRAWEPACLVEIDLHLPEVDMHRWTSVQHLKCRVAPGQYRDYTPAGWDADTHTCTLYVSTAHQGAGSRWANALKKGDEIIVLGAAPTPHRPAEDTRLVCLGDESTIGHFFALQQLAGEKLSGAIALSSPEHCRQLVEYLPMNMEPLVKTDKGGEAVLCNWVNSSLPQQPGTTVYVAGHIPAVQAIRRQLKKMHYGSGQVKVQGFWS